MDDRRFAFPYFLRNQRQGCRFFEEKKYIFALGLVSWTLGGFDYFIGDFVAKRLSLVNIKLW